MVRLQEKLQLRKEVKLGSDNNGYGIICPIEKRNVKFRVC